MSSFGKNPSGEHLALIRQSPNYSKGAFQNLSPTPMMTENSSLVKLTWRFLNKPSNTRPHSSLPSLKSNLKNLQSVKPEIIWFGHSSYFIYVNSITVLVDPVFSGHASPFSFGATHFAGSDIYHVEDFPVIDMLIITHDHFDHLDHRTIKKIRPKVKAVYTSLGVGSHLYSWGYDKKIITELDWWQSISIAAGNDHVELTALPARHFSGRTFKRNQTLWSSFALKTGEYNFYLGGDSGYDTHFKMIGDRLGPFDIAFLESGQYNDNWPFIHMMPEQTVQAAIDLRAKVLMPVHWGKFALAFHPWQEPVTRVLAKAKELKQHVTTPMIGEPVILDQSYPSSEWWKKI